MTWDFTPTQVMKGEVEYSFDDFYRDLTNETRVNFGERLLKEKLERAVNLNWIFCHLKATEPSIEAVVAKLSSHKPPTDYELFKILDDLHKENVKMLTAIYQRLFLQFYEVTLSNSWGDAEKAMHEAALLVDLYIKRHVRMILAGQTQEGSTPQA